MDMNGPSVEGLDWSGFYAEQAGRAIRPTFVAALEARGSQPVGFAIDVGCGDGVETRALLTGGWRVLAFDADPRVEERALGTLTAGRRSEADGVGADALSRLDVRQLAFADVHELPPADVVYAGFALPFAAPAVFGRVWAAIRSALRPGGVFAGEFFGPHDDWAGKQGMNVHDRAEVLALLDGLDVVRLTEHDRDGASFAGPKHWHVFHVVARRTVPVLE